MIRKQTRDVFITPDGKEHDSFLAATKHTAFDEMNATLNTLGCRPGGMIATIVDNPELFIAILQRIADKPGPTTNFLSTE